MNDFRAEIFAISLAVILFAMLGVEDRCFHKSSQLELSDGHSIHHLKGSLLHFILVVHHCSEGLRSPACSDPSRCQLGCIGPAGPSCHTS